MTAAADAPAGRRRPRLIILLSVVVLTLLVLAGLSAGALAYGADVRSGDQLLPGTTIATVPVGERSVDEAVTAVREHLEPGLERTITVRHGDLTWETTPRELGARVDVEQVVADAAARAGDLGFTDLVRLRWLGGDDVLDRDVAITVDEGPLTRFVAGLAADLDRDPRDAEVAWVDDEVAMTVEGRGGREVRQDDAIAELTELVTGEGDELRVPLDTEDPTITTAIAEATVTEVAAAVDAALDRVVTIRLDAREGTTSGRELGATPDVGPLVEASFAAATADGDGDLPDVDLTAPDGAIGAAVDEVTAGSVVPAKDATLTVSGSDFVVTPERNGAAVDRAEAIAEVDAALDGGADTVELELRTLRPSVTADAFDRVLVVDQSNTTVSLFRGGEQVRSWPVAVGTNNSPTPTGTFVVGAKRFEPTWTNPAPDRWGKDMPARIGPGPDNPLGVRALNWNRPGGGDTLIRFHGTPNEASIGSAASNGCVRMFNDDVIELYDLVPSGTMIISQA